MKIRNQFFQVARHVSQDSRKISIVRLEASAPTKCHGRTINHISKIIPAARDLAEKIESREHLETPES